MPELRRRSPADADAVVGWVVDADALYLFTGAQLRWPLRLDDLLAMDHVPGFAAWVLADGIHMAQGPITVEAQPEEVLTLPIALRGPGTVAGGKPVAFTVKSSDGSASEQVDSKFFGPM